MWAHQPEPSPTSGEIQALGSGLEERNPWMTRKGYDKLWKEKGMDRDHGAEVKYDVRSARGGRGGKVAAVKAIWDGGKSSQPTKPPTKPKPTFDKNTTTTTTTKTVPISKPTPPQVPSLSSKPKPKPHTPVNHNRLAPTTPLRAIISSSHAIPTISSTASLARPISSSSSSPKPKPKPSPFGAENRAGKAGRQLKIGMLSSVGEEREKEIPDKGRKEQLLNPGPVLLTSPLPPPRIGRGFSHLDSESPPSGSGSGTSTPRGGGANNNGVVGKTTSPATTTKITPGKTTANGEMMAFGQAKLRDLIKKYQGQATGS